MLERLDTLIAFAVVMLGVSLIITILTQIVSSFLGLRGSNLLWGIEVLLKDLDPKLENKLEAAGSNLRKIAAEILTDPLISDSTFSRTGEMWLVGPVVALLCKIPGVKWLIGRWRYATAIRAEELARMVEKKAISLTAEAAAAANSGSVAPGSSPTAEAAAAFTEILQARDPETRRGLDQLKQALAEFVEPAASKAGGFSVQVDKIFQQATDVAQKSLGKLETSFNAIMDRVSQRFALQMRLWTVVFAFALAFGVHLDSFRLLNQLSTNTAVRSALVDMRDSMLKEADTVLPPQGATPAAEVPVSPTLLNEALVRLKATDTALARLGPIPNDTTTVTAAVAWLKDQLQHEPSGTGQKAEAAYRRSVVSVLRAHAGDLTQQLEQAGIDLIPRPYPGLWTFDGRRNVLGILVAAALLSLGAPFWYNALKNLSNLRTVVATRQKQETEA